MDPRQLFDPKNANTNSDNCSYSLYSSVSCTDGECVKQTHQFRQCGNRAPEELVQDEDGSEHWVPTENEADNVMDSGFSVSLDNDLRAVEEMLSDSFVGAMLGLQSKLVSELLQPVISPRHQHSLSQPRTAIITNHTPVPPPHSSHHHESTGSTNQLDESIVRTPVDAVADSLHSLVDQLFGRKSSRRQQSDEPTKSSDDS